MSLTSLEAVKVRMRIPSEVTDEDDLIRAVLDSVEAEVLAALHLSSDAPTEYTLSLDSDRDGEIPTVLRCEPRPVISVDSVDLSGSALTADDYRLEPPHYLRIGGMRVRGTRTGIVGVELDALVVVVTAGFETVPPALAFGVAELAAIRVRANPDPSVRAERWGRYAVEREPRAAALVGMGVGPDWPASLLAAIGPYLDTSHTLRTLRIR